jgi:hypothetical protein
MQAYGALDHELPAMEHTRTGVGELTGGKQAEMGRWVAPDLIEGERSKAACWSVNG